MDVEKMGVAVHAYIRARAKLYGSYIIYKEQEQLIQEDPRTGEKKVLKTKK